MKHVSNEFETVAIETPFSPAKWDNVDLSSIYAGDIRNPWKSVHGFTLTAARLAAGQKLILHCREDEVFKLLKELNELLKSPEILTQAYKLLTELKQETRQKLARLIELEEQPLTEYEIMGLLEDIEQILAAGSDRTLAGRLKDALSPNKPVQEIAGVSKMLAQLQALTSALGQVKDRGFHVVVCARRRQPHRPALEARRNEPIMQDGKPSALPAGFLLPTRYHLTLWAYLVVRNDNGQSTIWN